MDHVAVSDIVPKTMPDWADIAVTQFPCSTSELDLANTLDCGQAFRWRRDLAGHWTSVIGFQVFRIWRSNPESLSFQAWPTDSSSQLVLSNYLRLDVALDSVQAYLAERDPQISEAFLAFPGMRVIAQDPIETIFTFLCSPANNVTRITRSVDLLCSYYGTDLGTYSRGAHFGFPSSEQLSASTALEIVSNGALGFRGKNVHRTAVVLSTQGDQWTTALVRASYNDARTDLMKLPGIGPKIADCIALFGLRHDEAVPVDTHVWAIARSLFPDRFQANFVTPATYDLVREAFLERYGKWAGWAQQYLFHARRVARALPTPSLVRISNR